MKKIILTGMVVLAMNAMTAQTNTATGSQTNGNQTNGNQTNGNQMNGNQTDRDQTTGNQNNQIKVPSQVMDKFNSDYPNTNVTWGREGENYTATYKDQDTQGGHMVTYDKNGKVLHTDSEMNGSGYPTGIDDYYTKNHPNEKYSIWSSDDGKGDMTYYSKGKNGKTSWFDKDGKYSSSRPGGSSDTQHTKNNKGNSGKDKTNNNNTSKGTK